MFCYVNDVKSVAFLLPLPCFFSFLFFVPSLVVHVTCSCIACVSFVVVFYFYFLCIYQICRILLGSVQLLTNFLSWRRARFSSSIRNL